MQPERFDPVPPGKIYMVELEKLYIENSSCWVPQIKLEILSHDKQGQKVSIAY